AIIGAGGIGFDAGEFLLHTPGESLEAWRARWGVADPAESRGGLGVKVKTPARREVHLLQRKETALGKGLGKTTGWVHRATMQDAGVSMLRGVEYERIDDDGLHLKGRVLAVDTIVLCAGQVSVRDLVEPLTARNVTVHVIGGADVAAELDAKRAIKQATELAARL
ncbi:MAG TPA: NADPH-dependent 2,4-dienoyl-CoA reductase, partial [Actinoplanes sp.]|nr:NADPH-dependent 2,4-dienoyl-CoA reductase [Actinoplanes sp.]